MYPQDMEVLNFFSWMTPTGLHRDTEIEKLFEIMSLELVGFFNVLSIRDSVKGFVSASRARPVNFCVKFIDASFTISNFGQSFPQPQSLLLERRTFEILLLQAILC